MVGDETDLDNARRFTGLQGPEFQSSLAQRRQSVASGGSGLLAQDDEVSAGSSNVSASDGSDGDGDGDGDGEDEDGDEDEDEDEEAEAEG